MPPEPALISIEQRDRYRILWLAGVRHVDLTQHCLRTFGMPDRPRVDLRRRHQTIRLPGDNPPLAWYLCALPHPWCWDANAHLAFEYAPGHSWAGNALVPGVHVELDGARPILGWGEHTIPRDVHLRQSRLYRTCRNWQFAWWLRLNRDAPYAPPPPPEPPAPGPDQLTLM